MNTENLNKFGLVPFDTHKIGVNEVYNTSVSPFPEKVLDVVLLKDGSIVCQWLNGTVSYASQNQLAMKELELDLETEKWQ
jgi:hypothetical protein